MVVATPSGITLAPEGGAHQSISTPLIGVAQDGLAYFEPAYADELAVIMGWAIDYMQRDGSARADAAWRPGARDRPAAVGPAARGRRQRRPRVPVRLGLLTAAVSPAGRAPLYW